MVIFALEGYRVSNWHDLPDGRGTPSAVVFSLMLDKAGEKVLGTEEIGMRLKSPAAVDELVAALQRHKFEVWPSG
jgi:hypothetical protein